MADARRFLAGLLFLLPFAAGCATERPAPARLLVLISIDTLRPDHLGAYGYVRPTSPNLDRIATEGVLFEDVTSTSPWTLPAHASLLTGLYPDRHGMRSAGSVLPEALDTLAGWLADRGFATAAIVNSNNLSKKRGLDRGFEEHLYVRELAGQREPSRLITDRALRWLGERAEGRGFLFLHYYDVHSDYVSLADYEAAFVAPYAGEADGTTRQLLRWRNGYEPEIGPDDADHLRERYDAGIRQLDDELVRLTEFLRERGLADETLLVVTSDHGEEFFEHGGVLHGLTQHAELLRVPWLMRGPGVPAGVRVAAPVSLVDLMPTLLALLEVPAPAGLDGIDVSGAWRGAELPARTLFAGADHNQIPPDRTAAARRGRYALHYDRESRRHRLYDLERDPGETVDVSVAEAAVADRLLGELLEREGIARVEAPTRALSKEEEERLRSLGYLE